jgi:hypothetical protein
MDRSRWVTLLAASAVLTGVVALAPAQTGGAYRIDGAVIADGGATLGGGAFRISGTVGQPTTLVLAGSTLRFYEGFWSPAAPAADAIFSNGFDP